MRTIVNATGIAMVLVAMMNFALFFLVALMVGGDAVNGKKANGKYYVASHGEYTEVTEATWNYSRIHVYSLWVTHPLAIVGGTLITVIQNRESGEGKRESSKPRDLQL